MYKTSLFLLILLSILSPLFAQSDRVFDDSQLATVQIFIDPDSLARIYEPGNEESDHEYPARFIFQNATLHDTVENIGFRLRGNTSRYSQKKSFKVSFNTFEPGRKFYGLEKLNLNGEHNDPSIIRSKLCWYLFKTLQVPSSRAFHTMVFINGNYYGLYIAVEHVDENFVKEHFNAGGGNLYKCLWPADLTYLGSNPNAYKSKNGNRRIYDLITNTEADDYSDLEILIYILHFTSQNDFPALMQQYFDVDLFLRVLAVDVAVGSWDDYWFLKNNYYLYHNPASGQFEFIPYDYDNTFGVWWDGILAGVDWGTRDIYNWGNPNEARPLVERIMEVPDFKNRFSYYLDQLLNHGFNPDTLFPRIDAIQNKILSAAHNDLYRTLDYGFTVDDFHNSYDMALGGHVTYGLKPYITTRRNSALAQLIIKNIAPVLSNLIHSPSAPQTSDSISFRVTLLDDHHIQNVQLHYYLDNTWQSLDLFDDGGHNDGQDNDQIYGTTLPALNRSIHLSYYMSARDDSMAISTLPAGAPQNVYKIKIGYPVVPLFINEFLAANNSNLVDEAGDHDDWIEIYNGGSQSISLQGLYLSDNFDNPSKWSFPDTLLPAGKFLLVWADEEKSEGPLHTNFKLNKDGEQIGIFQNDSSGWAPVDTLAFGSQTSDVSYGRQTDGGGPWKFFDHPTPGQSNTTTGISGREQNLISRYFTVYQNYPNPFNPSTTIRIKLFVPGILRCSIFDLNGKIVKKDQRTFSSGTDYEWVWQGEAENGKLVASGLYFFRASLELNDHSVRTWPTMKIILLK
jgi:spore coat protein H